MKLIIIIFCRHLFLPKKSQPVKTKSGPEASTKCKGGSVAQDIAKDIERIKELLEKKNIMWDIKKIEPPQSSLANDFKTLMENNGNKAFEDLKNCRDRRCQLYKS